MSLLPIIKSREVVFTPIPGEPEKTVASITLHLEHSIHVSTQAVELRPDSCRANAEALLQMGLQERLLGVDFRVRMHRAFATKDIAVVYETLRKEGLML